MTPLAAAYLTASTIGCGAATPVVPKLMLIASAPPSAACTIDRATEPSPRSVLTMSRRQFRPAPTLPTALSPAAQASEATCVPWPCSSVVAGPWPSVASLSMAPTILPCRSGCPPSTPVSMIAAVAPSPRVTSQAAGRPMRPIHQATVVPAGVPGLVSGDVRAGSLGTKRRFARCSTSTARTPGRRRRVRASVEGARPPTGRTLTRPICEACAPSRRRPAVARTAFVARRSALVPADVSSVTSSRPVAARRLRRRPAPQAGAATSAVATTARVAAALRRITRVRCMTPSTRPWRGRFAAVVVVGV